jgi:hypothetical protein
LRLHPRIPAARLVAAALAAPLGGEFVAARAQEIHVVAHRLLRLTEIELGRLTRDETAVLAQRLTRRPLEELALT